MAENAENQTQTQTTENPQPQNPAPQLPENPNVASAELAKRLEILERELKEARAEAAKRRTENKTLAQEAEVKKTLEQRLAELEKAHQEAQAKALQAERKAALVGKVVDPEAALALLTDQYIGEDGEIKLEEFLKRYPFLKPQAPRELGGPSNPATGPHGNGAYANLEAAVKAGDPAAINAALDVLLGRK